MVRRTTQVAPEMLVSAILRAHGGLKDDTSVIVIDVMPPGKAFEQCSKSASSGCFCWCGSGRFLGEVRVCPCLEFV